MNKRMLLVFLLTPLMTGCGGDNASTPGESSPSAPAPVSKTLPQNAGPAACPNPAFLVIPGAVPFDLVTLADTSEGKLVTERADYYVLENSEGKISAFHGYVIPEENGGQQEIKCREIQENRELSGDHLISPFEISLEDGSVSREIAAHWLLKKDLEEKTFALVDTGDAQTRQEKEAERNSQLHERNAATENFSYKISDTVYETRYFQTEKLKDGVTTRESSLAVRMKLVR